MGRTESNIKSSGTLLKENRADDGMDRSRNQWKRERYAPSFHLDDENLDPRTWCRFPILSGGFVEELKQLRTAISSSNCP